VLHGAELLTRRRVVEQARGGGEGGGRGGVERENEKGGVGEGWGEGGLEARVAGVVNEGYEGVGGKSESVG